MWDRIAAKYNSAKPSWAYKRNKEQLRKCWDRLKLHVNNYRDIYTKFRDGRDSGESMEDVIQKSMVEYQSKYGQFKFYDIWLILKDKPKFDEGIPAASSAAKRTKNTATGGYTSNVPSPMDLNAELKESSGTPTFTFRRPVGNKTVRAQAKGKVVASGSAPPQVPPAPST
ncbi:uncharacterized protein LOC125194805 [Salvia hispanica]|uniref:uncharacterized protein LOC125194805 n=1 Tax=Salvia hispanica TaxID=49212 RepID=UPI0020095C09|nr:uncharacterized protein LOC125194805 [Salvia hispanica]